jgi:2-oxoglutarate dehydrogenase E1 component
VVSPLEDFTQGRFQCVIPDPRVGKIEHCSRILLSAGKIYWELRELLENNARPDIALVALEQLYPLPVEQLQAAMVPFADGTPVYWVQEEPENMGTCSFLKLHFGRQLFSRFPFDCIARPASATPATGSASRYHLEQQELHSRALEGESAIRDARQLITESQNHGS